MIALITPTGARPGQIKICEKLMRRQTYQGEIGWVIVDDCHPESITDIGNDFPDNWSITRVLPSPKWKPGMNTQSRNMREGMKEALTRYPEAEYIFIIEDDDYYKPEYLEAMMTRIKGFDVAGEQCTVYYNVSYRRYTINNNLAHSSLFQTVLRRSVIKTFQSAFGHKFIDAYFFQILRNFKVNLFRAGNLSVGIKGMPGRQGIGYGHKQIQQMRHDYDMRYLKSLIGNDYQYYEKFYYQFAGNRLNGQSRQPLFVTKKPKFRP